MDAKPLLEHLLKEINLSEEEQTFLFTQVQYRKYLKGQYILQQGDVCKHSNYVVSGCAKMAYIDKEGHEHIVMFAVTDWWLSDLGSFITQTPSDYNIQCLEPTEVIRFTQAGEEELLRKIPQFECLFRQKLQNALVSAQKRIILNFSHTAKERYLLFKKQYPNIEQRIPQYMVASYLGVTKEFFSKMKNETLLD